VEEQSQVDQVLDGIYDLRSKYVALDNLKTGKDEARAEFLSKTLPHWFALFTAILEKNGTGFFVGNKITLADIQAFNINWNWHNRQDLFPGEILKAPVLKAHMDRIGAEPSIASWVARRPATPW